MNYNSDAAGAEATAEEIRATGRRAITLKGNVGVSADVDAMFCCIEPEFAKLAHPGQQRRRSDLESAARLGGSRNGIVSSIPTLKGTFLCTQRAARRMKDAGGGSIINLGSGCNKLHFPTWSTTPRAKVASRCSPKLHAAELGQYGSA